MSLVCTPQTLNQGPPGNFVCASRNDFGLRCLHNDDMVIEERNHLKAWREKRGLSQDELAEKAGTTKSVISLLENEKRPLSAKWLRRFAEVLDTRAGYILDHDPNELNDDVFDLWDNISEMDRSQAARVLGTFARNGTKG
jgi:transcriptional regulator with XRE-family HTH domain